VHDHYLTHAANALSRAIGGRWDGWYAVAVGRDPDGAGSLRVSFDRGHRPALTVNAEYNGYRVHLHPVEQPTPTAAQ
jgi:hypothetical protein